MRKGDLVSAADTYTLSSIGPIVPPALRQGDGSYVPGNDPARNQLKQRTVRAPQHQCVRVLKAIGEGLVQVSPRNLLRY